MSKKTWAGLSAIAGVAVGIVGIVVGNTEIFTEPGRGDRGPVSCGSAWSPDDSGLTGYGRAACAASRGMTPTVATLLAVAGGVLLVAALIMLMMHSDAVGRAAMRAELALSGQSLGQDEPADGDSEDDEDLQAELTTKAKLRPAADAGSLMTQLTKLRDAGLLTDEEYEEKKSALKGQV